MTKSVIAPRWLRAQNLPDGSLLSRSRKWRRRIDDWNGERPLARQLYTGGYWSVVREITRSVRATNTFVISAGYGLVGIDSALAPYAATFALGQDDSVSTSIGKNGPNENTAWWDSLCAWNPRGLTGPRSILRAVEQSPGSVHLFVLSPSYLDALSRDLAMARDAISDPTRLIILSIAKKRHGDLNGNVLTVPASVQTVVGGALVSLNIRVAAEALKLIPATELSVDNTRDFVRDLSKLARPKLRPSRRLTGDKEVVHFVRRTLKYDAKPSYTRFLRLFRDSGRACEMKRFKALFQQVAV